MELSTPKEPQKKHDEAHKKHPPSRHLCRKKSIGQTEGSANQLLFRPLHQGFLCTDPQIEKDSGGKETSGMPGLVILP